jgi:hypothetical protein
MGNKLESFEAEFTPNRDTAGGVGVRRESLIRGREH